ncbi:MULTISPECIES: class Ib ribonucleoside-diphosphate reductase assembly flavoprotein NrdI [Streptococcus]|uniref:Putative NrdI-like protein n=1 Tax=Streptococcus porcorum TaxID=701526 RepID=A0ABV2JCU4_9STRE|nr:class Ib ribonucleoside-diphosphate reductase assembly flavoprotein NrdI [Streptococcus sp.]MDY3823703.1 class Ib ribonucleoside-diphosphate reductase assembly flavoprotein NrdI [Streptococcus sp.]
MKLAFYSLTGQTRRFVKKLNLPQEQIIEIKRQEETLLLDEDFILITPTYEDGLEFLDRFVESNHHYMRGLMGSGNRNFGPEFCHVARRYAKTYGIPVLYEFEFNGTPEDVEKVKGILSHGS